MGLNSPLVLGKGSGTCLFCSTCLPSVPTSSPASTPVPRSRRTCPRSRTPLTSAGQTAHSRSFSPTSAEDSGCNVKENRPTKPGRTGRGSPVYSEWNTSVHTAGGWEDAAPPDVPSVTFFATVMLAKADQAFPPWSFKIKPLAAVLENGR